MALNALAERWIANKSLNARHPLPFCGFSENGLGKEAAGKELARATLPAWPTGDVQANCFGERKVDLLTVLGDSSLGT